MEVRAGKRAEVTEERMGGGGEEEKDRERKISKEDTEEQTGWNVLMQATGLTVNSYLMQWCLKASQHPEMKSWELGQTGRGSAGQVRCCCSLYDSGRRSTKL